MDDVLLEEWSIVQRDPYAPPELNFTCLRGRVYDHPIKDDGKNIITSKLETLDSANGRAKTFSRWYKLGRPDPEFVQYMHDNGKTIQDYEEVLNK